MGWTHRDYRPDDVKDFICRAHEFEGSGVEVMDIALTLTHAYVAVRRILENDVVCAIWLIRYTPDGGFSYKVMDETMGPGHRACPQRILDQLTEPAPNDHARDWRAACHDRLLTRAAKPTLRAGDRIRISEPLRFRDGIERQEFTVIQRGRRRRYEAADGAICRFDPKHYDYEVINSRAVAFDPAQDA